MMASYNKGKGALVERALSASKLCRRKNQWSWSSYYLTMIYDSPLALRTHIARVNADYSTGPVLVCNGYPAYMCVVHQLVGASL